MCMFDNTTEETSQANLLYPGNVSKEMIICHPLNVLKQKKTHGNLHSYWKDLRHRTCEP